MNDRPTPESDAFYQGEKQSDDQIFAQKLERERDALREALASLRACISETRGSCAREAVERADELLTPTTPKATP